MADAHKKRNMASGNLKRKLKEARLKKTAAKKRRGDKRAGLRSIVKAKTSDTPF